MRFHTFFLLAASLVLLLSFSPSAVSAARPRSRVRAGKNAAAVAKKLASDLSCGACLELVAAIERKVATAAIDHPYDVLSRFRLDEKRRTPYCRSESFVQGITDGASQYSHLWGARGYVPSDSPPLRVAEITPSDGSAPIPGLVATSEVRAALTTAAAGLLEEHQDALTLAVMRAKDADASAKAFCVEVSKACEGYGWPVQWPESSYVPPPPSAPAAEGEAEAVAAANVPAAAVEAAKAAAEAAKAAAAAAGETAAAVAATGEGATSDEVKEEAKDEL